MSTTETVVTNVGEQKPFTALNGYKEFSPLKVNREAELKGDGKFDPASYPLYLPVWDNEKGRK